MNHANHSVNQAISIVLDPAISGIIRTILSLRDSGSVADPQSLRERFQVAICAVRECCRQRKLSTDSIDDIVYALVATIDESVLSIGGSAADYWLGDTLQLELFGDNNAGEQFFIVLDRRLKNPAAAPDVIAIFHQCLSLGFEGKYLGSTTKLQEIIVQAARALIQITNADATQDDIRSAAPAVHHYHKVPPLWTIPATAATIILLCWIWVSLSTAAYAHKQIKAAGTTSTQAPPTQ